jgi:uncharacterized repeat protein (TIGR01451 family)
MNKQFLSAVLLSLPLLLTSPLAGAAGTTTRVSLDSDGLEADGASDYPALSADGRFVAFESSATNLVTGDTNGYAADVFVRDRLLDKTLSADLTLAAVDAPDPIQRGKTLSYTFTVKNKGADRATGATLVDVLSSNLILNTVTPSQGACNKAHVLVCRLGSLAKDKSAKVTVKARVRTTTPRGPITAGF